MRWVAVLAMAACHGATQVATAVDNHGATREPVFVVPISASKALPDLGGYEPPPDIRISLRPGEQRRVVRRNVCADGQAVIEALKRAGFDAEIRWGRFSGEHVIYGWGRFRIPHTLFGDFDLEPEEPDETNTKLSSLFGCSRLTFRIQRASSDGEPRAWRDHLAIEADFRREPDEPEPSWFPEVAGYPPGYPVRPR